jgi:hypothetical protein
MKELKDLLMGTSGNPLLGFTLVYSNPKAPII